MATGGYGGEGPVLMAVGWTECTLGVITIGLRLYGASKRAGQIRWDFLWIALAGVCTPNMLYACLLLTTTRSSVSPHKLPLLYRIGTAWATI